jgi:hypothetical protein
MTVDLGVFGRINAYANTAAFHLDDFDNDIIPDDDPFTGFSG